MYRAFQTHQLGKIFAVLISDLAQNLTRISFLSSNCSFTHETVPKIQTWNECKKVSKIEK